MTARERLRELVETLPDEQVDEAIRCLEEWRAGRGVIGGYEYGPDDSPLSPEEEEALREGLADRDGGGMMSGDELQAWFAELRRRHEEGRPTRSAWREPLDAR